MSDGAARSLLVDSSSDRHRVFLSIEGERIFKISKHWGYPNIARNREIDQSTSALGRRKTFLDYIPRKMEKDQPDSLATVAVVSEKMAHPPHSNYAPSEVYSSTEPPPVSIQNYFCLKFFSTFFRMINLKILNF